MTTSHSNHNTKSMTTEQIIDKLQTLSYKPTETYTVGDRQEIQQLRIPYAKILATAKREASESDAERKRYRAKQMKLLSWTVKDREAEIEDSDGYQLFVTKTIKAQYIVDLLNPLLPMFSEMNTVVRDAEKQIGEEIK